MRWYVDITPIGAGGSAAKLCVEGAHWQKALQAARGMRGETEELSGLSVEFLAEGCRAFDPGLRLRYEVSRAPDDAPLGDGAEAAADAEEGLDDGTMPSAGGAEVVAPVEPPAGSEPAPPPRASKRKKGLAQTMAFSSQGAVEQAVDDAADAAGKKKRAKTMAFVSPGSVVESVEAAARAAGKAEPPGQLVAESELDEAPPPTQDYSERRPVAESEPAAAAAPAPAGALDEEHTLRSAEREIHFKLLSEREVPPTDDSPLSYRELVYGVDAPVTLSKAESFMRDRFAAARHAMQDVPPGKVVNLALFDHLFDEAPKRPPMVTLTWKDWRGEEPEIVFFPYSEAPARPAVRVEAASSDAPSAAAQPSSPPAAAQPSSPPAATRPSSPPRAPATESSPAGPSQPPPKPSAATSQRGRTASSPPASSGPDSVPPPSSSRHRRSRRQISPRRSAPQSTPPPASSDPAGPPSVPPAPAPPSTSTSGADAPTPGAPSTGAAIGGAVPAARAPSTPPSAARTPSRPPPTPAPSASVPALLEPERVSAPPATQPEATAPSTQPEATGSAPEAPRASWTEMTPEERARALAPRPSSPGGPRLDGDDLLTDMFEAMAELHFLSDALEGADFVLALALEKLPSEVGLVSLFDINRRQYVVVRQAGGTRSGLLLRLSQRAKLPQQAMRMARAVVVEDAESAPELIDERWAQLGVAPRSLICAPVELGGRYLGLIELANPHDGVAFKETDGHALTYIGRQFAEFVAERGVIVDPDLVLEDVEGDVR